MQEERIDIMAGEGMNEDEARFRVMTGKEPDELDRKLGFDFIPYQLGEKIRKIDAERLAFERKDINSDLLERESEVKEAVNINRFFADRKASKEISIDDVMAAVDASVGKNENGVRVLKNTVTGETATLSNSAISKMFSSTSNRLDSQNIGGILGKEAIANIGSIFDTAILVKTTPDAKHGTKNRILRYANIIRSDGENFIVKMTVKEIANKRPELTDIEIEDNGGKDLSAYDMKVGRKNTAEGNISGDKSPTIPNGTDITINDLIDFVNAYSEDSIQIDGKSRAARNSLGRRIARTEEGLRAFYKWFGDSKAVDEQGRPLVVYHGTSTKFDVFKGKYNFFSDSENVAGGYGSENPMPVYLSMKNPLIVDAYGQSFGEIYNAEGYKKAYKDLTENDYKKMAKAYDLSINEVKEFFPKNEDGVVSLARAYGEKPRSTNEWAEYAKKNGYDGVIIKDVNDTADVSNVRSTDYIAFEPNQIKSVENRGSFSPESDNIYYQRGEVPIPSYEF
ncbi:MAG: hypothetical protein MR368_07640 [Azospirillum sp.]|nr:hypothetical protein [Azospirillum sp.]